MTDVRFVPEARQEFLAQVAYYEKESTGLGGRFRREIEKTVRIATSFPRAGSPCAARTRRVIVKGFPFSIVYRSEGAGIVVFAVAHFRRHPSYWFDRV